MFFFLHVFSFDQTVICIRPVFIRWFKKPPAVIFHKVGIEIISKIIFIFFPLTLNIICLVEKIIYFLVSVCVF